MWHVADNTDETVLLNQRAKKTRIRDITKKHSACVVEVNPLKVRRKASGYRESLYINICEVTAHQNRATFVSAQYNTSHNSRVSALRR